MNDQGSSLIIHIAACLAALAPRAYTTKEIIMHPITGPFVTERFENGTGDGATDVWARYYRQKWRQVKPFNLALNFDFAEETVTSFNRTGYVAGGSFRRVYYNSGFDPRTQVALRDAVYAKAWSRFSDSVRDQASFSMLLAERRQSVGMITDKFMRFGEFLLQLKRKKFRKAFRALGIKKSKQPKLYAKDFAGQVLETQFGWKPLLSDVYEQIQILQSPTLAHKANGSCSAPFIGSSDYSYPPTLYEPVNSGTDSWYGKVACRIGADVYVDNPALALADQLGLVNPALVAFELIGFSFLFDWVATASEFLGGLSGFPGLRLENSYVSTMYVTNNTQTSRVDSYWAGVTTTQGTVASNKRVFVTRVVGPIPGPALRVRVPWSLQPGRGLNAIALCLQRLKP